MQTKERNKGRCSFCFVEVIHFVNDITCAHLFQAFGLVVIIHSLRAAGEEVKLVTLVLSSFGSALGTSEEIQVFLVWEIDIVVSVGVRVLGWVIPIVLPSAFGTESLSVLPRFEREVRYGLTAVIVTDLHGSFVSLVIDCFGTEVPLLLLTKSLEDVVRAYLHDADFLVDTSLGRRGSSTSLVVPDLLVATTGNHLWLKSHVL